MRNIRQKFTALILRLDLRIQIRLQFIVGRLQLRDCLFQCLTHLIEMFAQPSDFIRAARRIPGIEVQVCHALGQLCQLCQRFCEPFRHPADHDDAEDNRQQNHVHDKLIGNLRRSPDALHRNPEQDVVAVFREGSIQLQIDHISQMVILLLLNGVIVLLLYNLTALVDPPDVSIQPCRQNLKAVVPRSIYENRNIVRIRNCSDDTVLLRRFQKGFVKKCLIQPIRCHMPVCHLEHRDKRVLKPSLIELFQQKGVCQKHQQHDDPDDRQEGNRQLSGYGRALILLLPFVHRPPRTCSPFPRWS